MKSIKLNNGKQIPVLGLGTWQSEQGSCYKAVREAIKMGYRHISVKTQKMRMYLKKITPT